MSVDGQHRNRGVPGTGGCPAPALYRLLAGVLLALAGGSRGNMIIFPEAASPSKGGPAILPAEFSTARIALGEAVLGQEMASQLLDKADAAFQGGAYKHAAEILRRLAAMMPEQADILILVARAEIGLQHYPAAEALAMRAKALDPEPPAPHKILGFCAMRESRWREAIEFYRTGTRMDPADASAYQAMGMLHRHLGEVPEAEALFRKGMEADPAYYFSLSSLGNILVVQYEMEEALKVLLMTLQVDRAHERDWQNLLQAIEVRIAEKDQHPDGVPPLNIKVHRWNYQRAMVLVGVGRVAEAIGYFVKALRDEPNQAAYHNDLGSTLAALGRPRAALPFLETAIELDPGLPAAKQNLVQVKAALRKQALSRSVIEARERVITEPENDRFAYQLAVRYAEHGMGVDAVRMFIQAVKLAPDHMAYRIALARALTRLGRVDEAIKQLDIVQARQPADREVLHRRAWLSLHRAKVSRPQVDQAVKIFEMLCRESTSSNPQFMQSLALGYRMQGDLTKAAQARKRLADQVNP